MISVLCIFFLQYVPSDQCEVGVVEASLHYVRGMLESIGRRTYWDCQSLKCRQFTPNRYDLFLFSPKHSQINRRFMDYGKCFDENYVIVQRFLTTYFPSVVLWRKSTIMTALLNINAHVFDSWHLVLMNTPIIISVARVGNGSELFTMD